MKVLLCIALLVGCAMAASMRPRVVGGQEAIPHEFPYMVSLQWMDSPNPENPDMKHFCGGSLLNKRWVLTAAHCIKLFSLNTEIVAGAHNIEEPNEFEQRRKPLRMIMHEEYMNETGPHDIGLIEVEPFEFNDKISSVHLPDDDFHYPDGNGTLCGWGSTSTHFVPEYSDVLLKADLPILDKESCHNDYPETPLDETNICAGDHKAAVAACNLDSGSPLVKNVDGKIRVYGITSWSWFPCAKPGKTGVFVNVTHYLKWIQKHINA